ncbi:hypothetical protein HOLleu_14332 [Holothuria leucospilota]|uniref:C2H2-type domain-containing protein n=1 Tax=Holothuria leucospilota TaxID=206669 RepID=A0A9Q1HBM1_HOLLE|nr:hypothetical protein HOLleu_14332 [Holothuria leucospilota]
MEENVPHIKSEFHEDQEDEVDGWIPSTRSEVKVPSTRPEEDIPSSRSEDIPSTRSELEMEEQLSVSSIEEDGFFSVKIEVPDASLITDTDDEERAERHELHEGDETEDETNHSGEESGFKLAEAVNSREAEPAQVEHSSCPTETPESGCRGRPRFIVGQNLIISQQNIHRSWCATAKLLGISRMTLYRRRREFGMSTTPGSNYSEMDDSELDGIVRQILQASPRAGERILIGTLRSRGLHIQRARLRASIQRVDPVGRALRRCRSIVQLLDGNHRLSRCRFVTRGAGTSEGMSEHLSKTAFSQEFVEVERVMPNVGNDRQPSPSNSGIESIINSSVQGVFTQEKQCHLSTKELSQINEGKHSEQERKDSVTEAEIQPREEGNCPGNEFSILKNILEGNKSSRNVINCTKCLLCDQVFASKGDLDIHVKIHIGVRGNTGGNSEKNLESKDSLMQQKSIKTTEKRFKCDSCEKSYSSVKSLKRHRIAHSGVKQFKCQYCDKEFLSSHHVLRHERVHTGEKPFGCRYCPKKFSQKASLMGHEMVHTGEKPFICRFCEKRFVQKISLTRHERIHTGEKPFHCKYCDKRFVQESNLICHERVHTNEKPYGCSRCDKKFARKCDLIRHEEIHAREVPFRMFATSILQNLIKTHSSA